MLIGLASCVSNVKIRLGRPPRIERPLLLSGMLFLISSFAFGQWSYGTDQNSYEHSYQPPDTYSYGRDTFECELGDGRAGIVRHARPSAGPAHPRTPNRRPAASSPGTLCNDGTCVQGGKGCDGAPDCPDGSDEINCSFECMLADKALQGYQCADGTCAGPTSHHRSERPTQ